MLLLKHQRKVITSILQITYAIQTNDAVVNRTTTRVKQYSTNKHKQVKALKEFKDTHEHISRH